MESERVAEAIQAHRDYADWLESLPVSKAEALGWKVGTSQQLTIYACGEDQAWKLRSVIAGPGVVKEVTEDQTTWTRHVTERFTLRLVLSRASTCKPVYETEWETIEIDGIATWNPDTGKYQVTRKVERRVGWDCNPEPDVP